LGGLLGLGGIGVFGRKKDKGAGGGGTEKAVMKRAARIKGGTLADRTKGEAKGGGQKTSRRVHSRPQTKKKGCEKQVIPPGQTKTRERMSGGKKKPEPLFKTGGGGVQKEKLNATAKREKNLSHATMRGCMKQ